ncbi:MAG: MmgE/PrpD family protein [Chloroflexi bacterium]|nr:MmgE/PrpD family protein [Chloroflexota bacterium]
MDASAANGLTRNIARSVRGISYEALPADAVFLAKQCALDWFGVTLAGADEPLARILREQALDEGGTPRASLVGRPERVTLAQAALVNGAASHALDFDDVQMMMSGHPTVPVFPAVLALAEGRHATGRDLIAAFVAGFETECRAGAYVMPGHYATGFHATATLGTFGSAAACAHLLGLDEAAWLNALGIAGAQAAGLKAMFGTMCKPLHAGKAAANGLLAATLAARGFTSAPDVFEAHQGFGATQTTTPNAERALRGLGDDYAIRGVLFKYHAACYGTHETIEGVLRLKESHGIQPRDVAAIQLTVPPGHLSMCNIQKPATALEGKFSLRFTAALALATGDTSEQAFTDAAVRRADLVALRDRVSVAAASSTAPGGIGAGTEVRLTTSTGAEFVERVNLDVPATDLDRQWDRLAAKFRSLATPVLGRDGAAALLSAVRDLDRARDVAELAALAVPGRERAPA